MAHDPIKTPDHYRWHPLTESHGIECKDVIAPFEHHIGAAIAYLWRAGRKEGNTKKDDIKKAIRFLEYELERMGKDEELERMGKGEVCFACGKTREEHNDEGAPIARMMCLGLKSGFRPK